MRRARREAWRSGRGAERHPRLPRGYILRDRPPSDASAPSQNVLARLLEHTVGQNERRAPPGSVSEHPHVSPPASASVYCGLRAPAVPLAAYLARIFRYANCSPACYVFAFIYLERLLAVRD